jgi:exosortase
MVWLFYTPCLQRLWNKTNPITGEANWGHSIFVPIVGLYYLYVNRDELIKRRVKPLLGWNFSRMRWISAAATIAAGLLMHLALPWIMPATIVEFGLAGASAIVVLGVLALLLDWGLGSLIFGLLVFAWGIYPGQNDWLKDLGMVITLFGVVLTLCGWDVMKIAWFPILFLICALPWPGLVYSKVAIPLQNLAASVAVGALNLFGAEAAQGGTKIVIYHAVPPHRVLNVAEACAGMRSLMTFISVAATLAFLSNRALWQKIILTASAVPIAIFCNVTRVAGQGLLDRYVSEQLSQSFAHQFVGWVMLVPAFFLIIGVGWVLDQIFIEEVEDDEPSAGMGSAAAGGNT